MRIKSLFAIFFLLISCVTIYPEPNVMIGTFSALVERDGFESEYRLVLKEESIFVYSIFTQDAKPTCEGKWAILSDSILLNCDEPKDRYHNLTNGYMSQKDFSFYVVNKNSLKMGDIILKRVK